MELLRTRRSLDLGAAATDSAPRLSTDWLYGEARGKMFGVLEQSLIHISEPTRLALI
jgi:hypothetical protein